MKKALIVLTAALALCGSGCGRTEPERKAAAADSTAQQTAKPETKSEGGQVKHYGGLIQVRPEYEERYVIIHRHVWPEVLDRIARSNIRDYTIFMHEGCLYSNYDYVGADYRADMAAIAADPVTRDWWKLTDPMQEQLEPGKEGEWWAPLDILLEDTVKQVSSAGVERHGYLALLKPGREQEVRSAFAGLAKEYSGEAIRAASIQNFVFYLKAPRLFLYLEYYGRDFAADRERFLQSGKWLALEKVLAPCLERQQAESGPSLWVEMQDVFHTD
ncbi:L-rhamnose mutarotase [bacterium]|nr:L-rhamnose mutarotase [bacterium]